MTNSIESAAPATGPDSGLVVARRQIAAARTRGATPSDGGSTGKGDGND